MRSASRRYDSFRSIRLAKWSSAERKHDPAGVLKRSIHPGSRARLVRAQRMQRGKFKEKFRALTHGWHPDEVRELYRHGVVRHDLDRRVGG